VQEFSSEFRGRAIALISAFFKTQAAESPGRPAPIISTSNFSSAALIKPHSMREREWATLVVTVPSTARETGAAPKNGM